jgi:hypothetical protein
VEDKLDLLKLYCLDIGKILLFNSIFDLVDKHLIYNNFHSKQHLEDINTSMNFEPIAFLQYIAAGIYILLLLK